MTQSIWANIARSLEQSARRAVQQLTGRLGEQAGKLGSGGQLHAAGASGEACRLRRQALLVAGVGVMLRPASALFWIPLGESLDLRCSTLWGSPARVVLLSYLPRGQPQSP